MRKLRNAIAPAVLSGLLLSGAAFARTAGSAATDPQLRGVLAMVHDGISLDEAVSRAEKQYKARVVRTDVQDEDGRKVYVLKLLSEDGRVFTVRIDAATGRMR